MLTAPARSFRAGVRSRRLVLILCRRGTVFAAPEGQAESEEERAGSEKLGDVHEVSPVERKPVVPQSIRR